ncbi:MAG: hypothetical protein AAF565_13270 [Pseudomonadota bacterium]
MGRDLAAIGSRPLALVEPGDLHLAITEPAHFVFARVLSDGMARRVASWLARLATALRPAKARVLRERYSAILGPAVAEALDPELYPSSLIETQLRHRTMLAQLGARPTWRPKITVEGAEAVEEARAAGRGIVLWFLPQEATVTLSRLVCHDRGWRLHHMSHELHGPSRSRLGIAIFNQRDCRIETQFGPRLVMGPDRTAGALAEAEAVLKDGGTVGFRGISWARRPLVRPFFAGHVSLALGAPAMARRSGAALFAVAGSHSDEGYLLRFEALTIEEDLTQTGEAFIGLLERAVLKDAAFWSVYQPQWQPGPPPEPAVAE